MAMASSAVSLHPCCPYLNGLNFPNVQSIICFQLSFKTYIHIHLQELISVQSSVDLLWWMFKRLAHSPQIFDVRPNAVNASKQIRAVMEGRAVSRERHVQSGTEAWRGFNRWEGRQSGSEGAFKATSEVGFLIDMSFKVWCCQFLDIGWRSLFLLFAEMAVDFVPKLYQNE